MGGQGSKEEEQSPSKKLGDASKQLSAKIEDLEGRITKADEEAKQWIAKKDTQPTAKARAMQAIKRKKLYEQQRDQLLGTQFNLENMAIQQEQAQVTLTAVEAMSQATGQLKAQKEKIGVDQVEKLTDDMQELAADMADINAALAQGASTEHDEEAEAELAALYAQEADKEAAAVEAILMGGGAASSSAALARPAAVPT
eukprot:CAMPEP_0195058844 /NCGR_PEP_ID=MMETSP0448-20130528/6509_1 /TAXON_ID=66468 /ORGANISM="Heterocapsa triquestra, Strain CCMP 448" /LENGTH=198 /DNA_ID=CAMNT_0040089023 /DNA_START=79 /DNA_END=671 /DNA_ORIENTATION=+